MDRARRNDRIEGLVWLLLGLAVAHGAWTMDRLERLGIHPLAAPGLLPGIVGVALAAFGIVMLLRRGVEAPAPEPADWARVGASLALCLAFGGLLLGRGLPFWLLAGGFLLAHVLLIHDGQGRRGLAGRLAVAAALAVAVPAVVTWAFQALFYIRLP
jgi:uncharacterized membrane protein YhhN